MRMKPNYRVALITAGQMFLIGLLLTWLLPLVADTLLTRLGIGSGAGLLSSFYVTAPIWLLLLVVAGVLTAMKSEGSAVISAAISGFAVFVPLALVGAVFVSMFGRGWENGFALRFIWALGSLLLFGIPAAGVSALAGWVSTKLTQH